MQGIAKKEHKTLSVYPIIPKPLHSLPPKKPTGHIATSCSVLAERAVNTLMRRNNFNII
jgi:hypothetical protein